MQNNNSLAGTISLRSNSQINTVAGTLTLNGAIQDPATPYSLTKTGSGTLVLAGGKRQRASHVGDGGRRNPPSPKQCGPGFRRRPRRRCGQQRSDPPTSKWDRRSQRVADPERRGDRQQRLTGKCSGHQFRCRGYNLGFRQPSQYRRCRRHAQPQRQCRRRVCPDQGRLGNFRAFRQQRLFRGRQRPQRNLERGQPERRRQSRPIGSGHRTGGSGKQ